MRAGGLRHRLALQSKSETRGAAGGVSISWATQATVWGSIRTLKADERIEAGRNQVFADVEILIRYHPNIRDTWRLVDTSSSPQSVYSIINLNDVDERRRMMRILCERGAKDG